MESNNFATDNAKMSKKKKILIILGAVIVIAFIAILIFWANIGKPLNPNDTQSISVEIESGYGTSQIADVLRSKGIIDNPKEFRLWSRIKGYDNQYKAGIYSLDPSMSFKDIAEILVGGKISLVNFTIPEGYTIYQVADTLSERGLVDRETFVNLLENGTFDYSFLDGAQQNKNHLEGYLFPNTYSVAEGSPAEEYINVMLKQFGIEVTEEYYKKAEELGLTMNEVITIASIIEREAVIDRERPLVASVIYNRLKIGMPLQMCSTVQYVLGEQKAVLSTADTQIASPYNTYLNTGLPPGPICSPGLASIDAALNPADTDYLYFVLSDKLDGTSKFSTDYAEFERNKSAYYAAYEAKNS
jgi:UPF0755 protein